MIANLVRLREWRRGDSPGDGTTPHPDSARWRACPWSGLLFHSGEQVPQQNPAPGFWTHLPSCRHPRSLPHPRPPGSGVCKPSLIPRGIPGLHWPLLQDCLGCPWAREDKPDTPLFLSPRGGGLHLLLVVPCHEPCVAASSHTLLMCLGLSRAPL